MRINSDDGSVFSMTKTHLIQIVGRVKYCAVKRSAVKRAFKGDKTIIISGYYFKRSIPTRFKSAHGHWHTTFYSDISVLKPGYDTALKIGCKLFMGEDLLKLKQWALK
jgi:hypothetical protein